MKTKYPSIFGILAIFMLVASLVVPANLVSPTPAEASFDAGICKWDNLEMPNSVTGKWDILGHSEVNKLVVGPELLLACVNFGTNGGAWRGSANLAPLQFASASYWGIIWSFTPYDHLVRDMAAQFTNYVNAEANVYDLACAPDDANFWAAVTSGNVTDNNWTDEPVEVWVTSDAGANWECTNLALAVNAVSGATRQVGSIDISADYGGKRDIAVGMRDGTAAADFDIWVVQSTGFGGWKNQTLDPTVCTTTGLNGFGDVIDLKFSPTYVGDASMAVVFSTDNATYYDVAQRDFSNNLITSWVFSNSVEVKQTASAPNSSPTATQIITADLELPSDFSGQSASLRRAYVSTDAGAIITADVGIFRLDDSTVYTLMDTEPTLTKRIGSIAYYGTYASGKLLAGEVLGYPCTATVPTWFTDSPTTCPIPCWYPALKPTTGAAAQGTCNTSGKDGQGNAQVDWKPDGQLALVGTGSSTRAAGGTWWAGLRTGQTTNDESAYGISRNNGETWNQLGLIDTTITKFNDVAPSPDCTTLYLASTSDAGAQTASCDAFDSVWRTSVNPEVTSPLMTLSLGLYYERVYCRVTALSCVDAQSNLPLLRLPPDQDNGEIVGWAARTTKAQAWSPDFGDYWANINPRDTIQDFAFGSSTLLYDLNSDGLVQKLPYTGTAWSTAEASTDTTDVAHMIAVLGDDILVGYASTATYPGAISHDAGATWSTLLDILPTGGNVHVAFDPDYANNGSFYVADDAAAGTVYRNKELAGGLLESSWSAVDMMAATNGAYFCPTTGAGSAGQYGLQLATTGADGMHALYSSSNLTASWVSRTLWPLWGLPKPGMLWDALNVFDAGAPAAGVAFTLEPWSLKKCGCLTIDTDTKLWALDNANYVPPAGMLWGFADCMAKAGPALITEDEMLIGCDPVSGRAQEVNFEWEQLCVAVGYDIEVAKNENFTIKVIDWVGADACTLFFYPESTLSPAAYIPAGGAALQAGSSSIAGAGNLECGHTYYWRVKVRQCATGQVIRSPWSEVKSFTVKAGLPVSADYYGLKLLSPDNGCIACSVSPASFSWSPFKGTTKYKFVLAKDAALTDVLAEAETATTAYEYDGTLDYSTNYFWRVMCVEPAPSDWSATFSFQTEAAPAAPEAPPEAPATPAWVWIIIALGAILVIVTLVLIFKTRRA